MLGIYIFVQFRKSRPPIRLKIGIFWRSELFLKQNVLRFTEKRTRF